MGRGIHYPMAMQPQGAMQKGQPECGAKVVEKTTGRGQQMTRKQKEKAPEVVENRQGPSTANIKICTSENSRASVRKQEIQLILEGFGFGVYGVSNED